ncbi:uncharacterized protein BKA55DRAFT_559139 [Fusarium redolens]|uniref:Uncharacterized protein n=1 Tax=Fusarium redolens TaxID=48865 RepID=A0A9P9HXU6_FUSRE|nr:uncharacterized protein BKA55DRAFT_559139 [Fusarium redolens]KAH7265520.1 hypothetical protein BKA55DRAFT_559139 [Fusarium redolens]
MPQLFEPKAGQETRFKFDDTPTYLFRLHVPHSAGSTDTTYVKSPAFPDDMDRKHELGSACGTDLLKLPPAEAAARLRAHLKWECQKLEGSPCNLMSWSSSLLFLLQYGLYRHTTDRDSRPKLPEISLIMIGTRDFPKQTFLRDLDALYCYYAYDCGLGKVMGWRRDDLYFGEYLSQGRLGVEGKCIQMTMQQLIDGGLFTVICPALNKPNNNWASWARTVCNLRIGIRKSQVVDKRQIRTAISLAQVYGGDKFVIPLALMLLGLRSQHSDNARILEAFRGMFTGKSVTHCSSLN